MDVYDRVRKFFVPDFNRRFFTRLIIVSACAYLVFGHVLRPMRIRGHSMEPTYRDGGFNFCFLWRYRFKQPEPGDVVIVKRIGLEMAFLKRVVATEGQVVEFRRGQLYIDGAVVNEPYASKPCDWEWPPKEVRPGNIYVVGDNRSVPIETHQFGQTPMANIAGGPLW